jgi:peptide-methionine (S)-S-oxide reductase
MKYLLTLITALLPMLASCETEKHAEVRDNPKAMPEIPKDVVTETATLAGGCYWCLEAAYRQLDGVYKVTSGFMGGKVDNPTYEQVCAGETGHAEVVQIVFDPKKISYERLLAWFWDLHDPTTLNRQGNDVGTQYRSAIFCHSAEQKKVAEASKAAAAKLFDKPIVTEIADASKFYTAPEFHQDYYFQNKAKNPYCRFVIEPKLKKLKLEH